MNTTQACSDKLRYFAAIVLYIEQLYIHSVCFMRVFLQFLSSLSFIVLFQRLIHRETAQLAAQLVLI